jgi:hypothetical protein
LLGTTGAWAQEYRAGYKIEYELFKDISSETVIQYRNTAYRSEKNNAFLGQTEIEYKRLDDIMFAMGFRFKNEKELDFKEEPELSDKYRYTADVKLQIPESKKDFTIHDRVRYQYSTDEDNDRKDFIRNEITLLYKAEDFFNYYATQELFYNIQEKNVSINRLGLGLIFELTSEYEIETYFIIESKINHMEVRNNYISGVEFSVDL